MNKGEILHIIAKGESETVEFKKSYSRVVGETLVSFANTSGGSVLIGVEDSGKIVGVSLAREGINSNLD